MRRPTLLLSLLVVGLVPAVALKVWRYRWAFGQDAGAAHSADWKNRPCTRTLADSLYDAPEGSGHWGAEDNRYFFPGTPGHSYYVHAFRTQRGCERARVALGDAQWKQTGQ